MELKFYVKNKLGGYEMQLVIGDNINRKFLIDDEYSVGSKVTELIQEYE